ncbi:MAG: CHAT domain-containing protein [Flavobacteriales bacterium]|jgi:CHAT domain-containing protein
MRKLLPLVFLLWPLFLVAQLDSTSLAYAKNQLKQGRKLRKAADYPAALLLCDSALMAFSKDALSYDTLMAQTYVEQGLVHFARQDYEDANRLARQATKLYESRYGFYNRKLVEALNLIGKAYFHQGNNSQSFYYYNKALAVMDSVATSEDDFWPVLYTNLGNYYFSNFDLENAILYYNKALAVDERVYEKTNLSLLIDYFNLAAVYNLSSEFENALLHYEKALDVFDRNGSLDSFYWATIQCSIGDIYFKEEEVDKAFDIYEKSLKPIVNRVGYNAFKSRAFRAKGKCLKEQSYFAESIPYFEKSMLVLNAKRENRRDLIYDCYLFMADAYSGMGKQLVGLNLMDTAFMTIGFDFKKPVFWSSKISKVKLIKGLSIKTKILLSVYKENGNTSDLLLAQQNNNLELQTVDSIKLDLKEKGSQQFVTDQFFSVYENAIAIEYELYQSDKDLEHLNYAFRNAENCKSNVLLEAVLKSKALTFANLPDILLKKELNLKTKIGDTERQIYTLRNDDVEIDSVKIRDLKSNLFDLKIEMQELLSLLEDNHESYFNLKYKNAETDLSKVQNELLTEHNSIIEFFTGEDHFYGLLINKDSVVLKRLGKTNDIEPLVKKYCKTLSSFRPHIVNMEEHCENLNDWSFELYQLLLNPFSDLLKEELTIIPDGILSYLSFDALVKTKAANPWELNTYDFLIHHHTISYYHSVELMLENKRTEEQAKKNQLLAIAPSFETHYQGEYLRSDELAPLQHNINEAEAILAFCDGKILKGESANRDDFFEVAEDYRAIHFATHGKANDKNGAFSYLAFSQNEQNSGDDNILFAQDIYDLDLEADLVVLSACETGIGEWERGEGMISMARAFSYAGAKNILTTLWKVNDDKAGILMQHYYRNLQKGMGKSSALRQAKLDYLAESKLENSHPFFWASFISLGNNEQMILDKPGGIGIRLLGGIAFVILLLGIYGWRRRSVFDQWMSRRV